jgi:Ca2+-binding EF-hand superfamily protein
VVAVAFALMDHNGNGSVDREEFSKVLKAIQSRASHPSSIQHKISANLMSAQGGLVKQFFGADGKKELTPERFKKFLAEMREAMTRLEFQYYDYNDKGYICARDFALSIVGHARIKHVDGYLDKIDDMPKDLAQKRITYDEFRMLRLVWRRLRQLSVALEFMKSSSGMDFTPEEFIDIVSRVMKCTLPQSMVDVLYYLFGSANGGLNTAFMMSVMDRSFETGPVIGGDQSGKKSMGGGGGGKSFFDCVSECTAKRSNG